MPDEWDACEDGDEPSPSQTGDVQLADSLTQEQAHGESSEQDVCDDSGSDDASSDDDDDSSSGLSTDSEEERERRLEEARAYVPILAVVNHGLGSCFLLPLYALT